MTAATIITRGATVRVAGHGGIAFRVLGWEEKTVPSTCYVGGECDCTFEDDDHDEECSSRKEFEVEDWSETETFEDESSGRVRCVMVGDDHVWTFDESDLTPLDAEDFCDGCGQIGCGHGSVRA